MIFSSFFVIYGGSGIVPICSSISSNTPSYENFKDYKEGKQSFDKFAERYKTETLGGLRVPTIVQEIYDMVGVNDPNVHIVLTCYEKDSTQCHRSLVSKWLTDGGILTRELILD